MRKGVSILNLGYIFVLIIFLNACDKKTAVILFNDDDKSVDISIKINDGASITANREVSIALKISDMTGITAFFLSETNSKPLIDNSGWMVLSSLTKVDNTVNLPFTLSEGNGDKTIYVWFKNESNIVSEEIHSIINLKIDVTSPIEDKISPNDLSAIINEGRLNTTSKNVKIKLSGKDNVAVTAYSISEKNSPPEVSDPLKWNIIFSPQAQFYLDGISYTFGSELGKKTIYVWLKDAAGNRSEMFTAFIELKEIDLILPQITEFKINNGALESDGFNVKLNFSGNDDRSIISYFRSESSVKPILSDPNWININPSVSSVSQLEGDFILSSGNGKKTVYLWLKDEGDNISELKSAIIELKVPDQSVPQGPQNISVLIEKGALTTNSTLFNFTLSATDPDGIEKFYISENSTEPNKNDSTWRDPTGKFSQEYIDVSAAEIFKTDPVTQMVTPGVKTIYVWFIDTKGNISSRTEDSIEYLRN